MLKVKLYRMSLEVVSQDLKTTCSPVFVLSLKKSVVVSLRRLFIH